jgi:hypothetical protein
VLTAPNFFVGGGYYGGRGRGTLTISDSGYFDLSRTLQIWGNGLATTTGPFASNFYPTAGAMQIAAGGKLIMNGPQNVFMINYGTAASPNASIRQYLQNGYNGGNWDAAGTLPNPAVGAITSATAAASNMYSIGYADGSDGAVAGLSGGQEEIKFTYAGDANLDGQVNLTDLVMFADHFGSTSANWDQGDFSYDGTVNLADLTILASHFGDGVGSPLQDAQVHAQFAQDLTIVESSDPAFGTAIGAAIPEPRAIALLGLGATSLLTLRRRPNCRKYSPIFRE